MRKSWNNILAWLLMGMVIGTGAVKAQQIPISYNYVFRPSLFNPAQLGVGNYSNVHLSHQQRKMAIPGWRSVSQFLNYSSPTLGRSGAFGWGAFLSNDIEHTENRLSINAAICATLMKTKTSRLAVGIHGGLMNWGSNYDRAKVYDRSDELIDNPIQFAELDAGMGIAYSLSNKLLRIDLNAMGTQLPGNFISSQLSAIPLAPHLLAGGSVLISPTHNLYLGPMVFYRNIIMREDTVIQAAEYDIGGKVELDRQNMWAGAAYRINRAAFTMGFGLRVLEADTVGKPDAFAYFVDMNAAFSYPMEAATIFGPSIEIGLNVQFGRRNRNLYRVDTVRVVSGSFWRNNGTLNNHMVRYIKPNGPLGLRSSTRVTSKQVELTYEFEDDSYQYCGNTPEREDDQIIRLGDEWIGVDNILENMVYEVIQEALYPDTTNVLNRDSLEALKDLVSLELSTELQVNEIEADYGAQGMMYEGELGTNNKGRDSLYIRVVYDGSDTIIGIGKDRHITNLELAALKLHAMRIKLMYDLDRAYGNDIALKWEGEDNNVDTEGKKVVYIKKLRILPNNPNQESFQVNKIKLKFTREDGSEVDEEGLSIDDDASVDTSRKGKKKRRFQRGSDRERIR